MPYDWERFEEGTTATAAEINGKLSDVATEINDLQELSIQPRSLHNAHLPSIVDLAQKVGFGTSSFFHQNKFIGYTDSTQAGGRGSSYSGWHVVSDGSNDLEIGHGGDPIDMGVDGDTIRLRSYFVMANIQVNKISVTGYEDSTTSASESKFVRVDYYGVFQFQLKLALEYPSSTSSPWFNIKRSQRYVNSESPNGEHGDDSSGGHASGLYNIACFKDVPLRLMVDSQEVRDWGYRYILGARVVCALWDNNMSADPKLRMQRCNLSIFSLQAPKSN